MEKPADTDYPINELIRRRWSPRTFSERPVEKETLARLLEAARWAPSCYNEQPWNFIVARKQEPEQHEKLLACLVEGNQSWAHMAPVLMLSVARLPFTHNGESNRHALHDVGLAVENMCLQATDMGLFVHQMAGFHMDKARERYGIPGDHEPVAALAVGYPADPKDLSEEMREREQQERTRRPMTDFVFSESWNSTWSFLES